MNCREILANNILEQLSNSEKNYNNARQQMIQAASMLREKKDQLREMLDAFYKEMTGEELSMPVRRTVSHPPAG